MSGAVTIVRNNKKAMNYSNEIKIAKNYIITLFPDQDPQTAFDQLIKSGVLFAQMCNKIKPASVNISMVKQNYHYMSNWKQSIDVLKSFGFHDTLLFNPSDIVKDPPTPAALHALCLIIFALELKGGLTQMKDQDKNDLMDDFLERPQELMMIEALKLNIPEKTAEIAPIIEIPTEKSVEIEKTVEEPKVILEEKMKGTNVCLNFVVIWIALIFVKLLFSNHE
ncbi:Rab-like_protein [Hexamita inflata]|uniref:Rab-like protein n=1 Tax=Hexamita inflata TaxID=28002 RepID=A0AA86PSA9_9EUKA|nr:Rab-like protein [Hexamita inflata]